MRQQSRAALLDSHRGVGTPRPSPQAPKRGQTTGPLRCRRKFLRIFPGGFRDPNYLEWERDYKWESHQRWQAVLGQEEFERLHKLSPLGRSSTAEDVVAAVGVAGGARTQTGPTPRVGWGPPPKKVDPPI